MVDEDSAARLYGHPLFRVGAVTLTYVAVAAAWALWVGNLEFVFYVCVMLALMACVAWVHSHVSLSPGLLWALSIWGALHMAGGLVVVPDDWPTHGEFRVLYSLWIIQGQAAAQGDPGGWLKYDQVVHAYGFGVATWLCWQGLQGAWSERESRRLHPSPGLMALVALAGMGLGAVNEVIEFVATRITTTNVGGYVNTGWDLVYNTLGSCVAAVVIFVGSRRRDS